MQARPLSFMKATEKSKDSQVESSSKSEERIFFCSLELFTKREGERVLSDEIPLEIKPDLRLSRRFSVLSCFFECWKFSKHDASCPEKGSFFGTSQNCFLHEKNLTNRIKSVNFKHKQLISTYFEVIL